MNDLFGLSMTYVAIGCAAVTALIFLYIGWIALRNPVMFKTGLRNIPRRPLQTTLIIIGLMLSTLIITAAFGTGDTMTNSITREVFTILGPTDQIVDWDAEENPAPLDQQVIPLEEIDRWEEELAARDVEVAAMVPYLLEPLPAMNTRTRLNEANSTIAAFPAESAAAFGGLQDIDGNPVDLGPGDIAVNEALAEEIEAEVGDTISLIYNGEPVELSVVAIAPNTLLAGATNTTDREGAAVNWDFLGELLGKIGVADEVAISNDGTERGGLETSSEVTAAFEEFLLGTPYEIEEVKKDNIADAELFGNFFTSIFLIFGLFSISAGILLIFLIFVMLAAERKPEMGMARAVGAKRRQIVESFLAEGMGYDIGSAIIGVIAGVGVAAAMVYFVKYRVGDTLGLDLQFEVSPRSLVVAGCLGLIVTFIVVFFASWRASRLNIVAAIRDLPETKPHDPEAATWFGFWRGVLNGMAAIGFIVISLILSFRVPGLAPVFLLAALIGFAGPFLPMLRNSNFGAPTGRRLQGEGIPKWPFWLGLATLIIGVGALILIGYALALLIIRLTRDRKPSGISKWWLVVGILALPVGLVMAALQDRGRPIAWGVGIAFVGLISGVLLVQWGLADDRMAWLALGVTFIALGVAMVLRYFHIRERLVFSVTSLFLIVIWYLLAGQYLEWLTGDLRADFEMFFITGAVLVTCGTFLVVYNADVILPAIAAMGARFGSLYPAVKTAIAYPLTSRFRTGLTIGMIGLIMFVLSMQSALNTNFDKTLTGEDALGGFDVQVNVNANNPTDDIVAALDEANSQPDAPRQVDTGLITAVGENRTAGDFEVEVRNPYWEFEDPATRDPEDEFQRLVLHGGDEGFFAAQQLPLNYRAAGYATDEDVWAAVANDPSLMVIPTWVTSSDDFGAPIDDGLEIEEGLLEDEFEPFTLTLVNRSSGEERVVTVIGQTKDSASTFWFGAIVKKELVDTLYPDTEGQTFFLALEDGTDADEYAKGVEGLLVQASADSMQDIIDEFQAQNRTFLEMFQGFLGLGLLVGIAALGVISLRAVVERRQQIGMLRAIGYQRSMVQLSFMFEAGFIALAGILLGLVLGLTFAYVLFTGGEFGESTEGIDFTVPWAQVAVVTVIAFGAAMLTTYLPARAASRVAVAEALRYE